MRAVRTLVAGAALALTAMSNAQSTYKNAPDQIQRALEAPPLPGVSLDPTRRTMLLIDRVLLPPVSDLAQPMLRLAGGRYNPRTNGDFGPRVFTGYTLKSIADGSERRIELPNNSDLSMPGWSPDGTRFAFTRTTESSIELWVADVATAKARKLADGVNEAAGAAFRWMPDATRLLVRFIPADRGPMPVASAAPSGPVVQETAGVVAQVRTYQDLLQNDHDERVFDWLMLTQPAYVDVATGKRTDIGTPAIYARLDPSPDGRFLLVSRVVRPYSYLVPEGLFPEVVDIRDAASGKVVKHLADFPLRETIPIEGVQTGPRAHQWRDTSDATLLWLEALDEGNPKNKVPHRDRVMVLGAPFDGEPREWLKTEHRFMGVNWMETPNLAMVNEYDRDKRWTRTWLYDADAAAVEPRLVFDRSVNDRYNNPGTPLTTRLPNGRSVIRVREGAICLAGNGATPDGDRPFFDRMSLTNLKPERLWRNEGECFESVIDVLPDNRILTSYETRIDPPNYFLRDLAKGTRTPVTAFVDPVPELRRIKKELIKYKRADGVDLSATMYLPADYQTGQKLPMLIWAYPLEFNDPGTAGQVSGSPYRFTSIGGISHLFLLTQGYAVMDAATMPIVGDPETMNDTFIEQITMSARAAIDKAVEMGISDGHRVAVGGHSYGAFMTANLLAHTDFFKAGLARSGAYNRTLTPFGFQGERRTYWEARDSYERLSPFTYANKIKTPILMIHGAIDSNPGTFPVQSERLYAAIKGNGGTARLIMLPFEDHGYAGRESVLHTHAETVEWLDKYVKNASLTEPASAGGGARGMP